MMVLQKRETIKQLNYNGDGYCDGTFLTNVSKTEFDNLTMKFKDIKLTGIINTRPLGKETNWTGSSGTDGRLYIRKTNGTTLNVESNNVFKQSYVSGMMKATDAKDFGFEMMAGVRLPSSADEICISKVLYDILVSNDSTITSVGD